VNGTGGTPKTAFYRHEKSYVAVLKIEGKTVRKVAQAEVSGHRVQPRRALPLRGKPSSTATSTSCGSMATR
jgi:hypothetical protein